MTKLEKVAIAQGWIAVALGAVAIAMFAFFIWDLVTRPA